MTTEAVPDLAPAEGLAVPEPSAPNLIVLPNGHTVTLDKELSVPLGMAAAVALQQAQGSGLPAIEFALTSLWLGCDGTGRPYTIRDWDFFDERGRPEPITPENIARLLPFDDGGVEVAEGCARLYGTKVMRPLVKRMALLLPPTSMEPATPPTSGNGHATRKHSSRSSRRNTAGKPRTG